MFALARRILATSFVIALLGGCASPTPVPATQDQTLAAPAVRGAQNGLEICAWPVDDRPSAGDGAPAHARVAEALHPYLDRPLPVLTQQADLWRRIGLRLVAVPIEDLELVRSKLRMAGPMNRQWLGQLPQWTPTVDGVRERGGRTLSLPEGPLNIGPGTLRLLTRAWTGPGELASDSVTAALRVDVVPQHQEPDQLSDLQRAARGLPPRRPTLDSGLIFSRFALSFTMDPTSALLVVPESPEANWADSSPSTSPAPAGPPLPRPPTLGEAMLSDAEFKGEGRIKLVVVLIPRVPHEYHLLPSPESVAAGR